MLQRLFGISANVPSFAHGVLELAEHGIVVKYAFAVKAVVSNVRMDALLSLPGHCFCTDFRRIEEFVMVYLLCTASHARGCLRLLLLDCVVLTSGEYIF
jgi:hypothetical protein